MATYTLIFPQGTVLDFNLHSTGLFIPLNEKVTSIQFTDSFPYLTVQNTFTNGWCLKFFLKNQRGTTKQQICQSQNNTGTSGGNKCNSGSMSFSGGLFSGEMIYYGMELYTYSGSEQISPNGAVPSFEYYDIVITITTSRNENSHVNSGRYNGSSYDPVEPFYYNGSAWVPCEWKRYNGSSWDDVDTM